MRRRAVGTDEPTSALDAAQEYLILLRFGELRVGKIAALISHDFSTVQMADRIVVFDGGQLSEVGCAGYVSHPASFPAWITQVASTSVLHDCDRRAA